MLTLFLKNTKLNSENRTSALSILIDFYIENSWNRLTSKEHCLWTNFSPFCTPSIPSFTLLCWIGTNPYTRCDIEFPRIFSPRLWEWSCRLSSWLWARRIYILEILRFYNLQNGSMKLYSKVNASFCRMMDDTQFIVQKFIITIIVTTPRW